MKKPSLVRITFISTLFAIYAIIGWYPQNKIQAAKSGKPFQLAGYKWSLWLILKPLTGRLAQLVERRTREHNVSGLYRCGFESPAGQLKLLIVFRMRR